MSKEQENVENTENKELVQNENTIGKNDEVAEQTVASFIGDAFSRCRRQTRHTSQRRQCCESAFAVLSASSQ